MDFGSEAAPDSGNDIDVDAIIANAYGQSSPTESAPTPEVQQAPVEKTQAQIAKEFEFKVKGQPIKVAENDPRHIRWLEKGYDIESSMEQLRRERQEWDQQRQGWEQNWNQYKEIDEYAKSNPDWWGKINQGFQQQQDGSADLPPQFKQYLDSKLEPIAQDLPLMKQFLQEMQTQKMEAIQKEEDTRLEKAIGEIQQRYPNLDFKAKDESGLSLEQRVLNHAIQNGIPTFRSAFFDYNHDQIEKLAEARGREATMKDIATRKKIGILDDSPAPSKSESNIFGNVAKTRSWNDPSLNADSILKEFKFG